MLFVSNNCSLQKVAFMNSSCFIICELNWIVFMAIVKHFRVKMRLAFFCCANLIKYKYTFCLVSLLFSLTSNANDIANDMLFSSDRPGNFLCALSKNCVSIFIYFCINIGFCIKQGNKICTLLNSHWLALIVFSVQCFCFTKGYMFLVTHPDTNPAGQG